MAGLQQALHWTPRVLGILFAVFISLFALDVFEEGEPLGRMLLGFAMHMIPTALVVIAVLVAWRWPAIGGLLFIALGVAYAWMVYGGETAWAMVAISGPLLLVGLLFVVDHFLRGRLVPAEGLG
jgi:hypothetical protein